MNVKALYYAENNYSRYYIVEDWNNFTAAVIDWDLSEDEEREMFQKFVEGKIDYYNYVWVTEEEAYQGLGCKTLMAYENF